MNYTIEELISMIDEPNRSICLKFYQDNKDILEKSKGSLIKHQSWEGGYLDHIKEVMNISVILYYRFNSIRDLPFKLSQALLILFLHDLEKPWKYVENDYQYKMSSKEYQKEFREIKMKEYGFILSDYEKNALKYVEGEHDDYNHTNRVMNELSAFCHICDVTSARIWYDYPKRFI